MINIQATILAAEELAQGEKAPSVKFAFWTAALSALQELEANGRLAELLRPYVNSPLPGRETLYNYLREAKGVLFTSHINALYYIEELDNQGKLAGLEHIGDNFIEQCIWRKKVYKLIHGHGMNWKTISLAALILDPLHSELVPVDRHVMRWLGKNTDNSPQSECLYLKTEQEVRQARDRDGYTNIPLGIYHWYRWELQRSKTGKSKNGAGYKGNGGMEYHGKLSCRVY